MKRLARNQPGIDYIKFLADFAKLRGIKAYSSDAVKAFGEEVVSTVAESVAAAHRVRGVRAESVFQAVVAGLGKVQLIKPEDGGDVYFRGDDVAPPDFRVVLEDGRQLLVEVKVQPLDGDFGASLRVSDAYMQRLRRYSLLTGGTLHFAVFWEETGVWTLNSLEAFHPGARGQQRWVLSFMRAFATNEMSSLGDCTIATRAPLRFRIIFDQERSEPVPEGGGVLQATIARVELLSQDRILDGLAAKIAWKLIWYGKWSEWPEETEMRGGKLVRVDYPIGPQLQEDAGVDPRQMYMVGALSEMISRAYLEGAENTIHTESGSEVLAPGWMGGEFIPDDWVDMKLDIPITKFTLQPNYDLWPPGSRPGDEE